MATFDNHGNFAVSTVATAPSPATSGTSLVVATGTGALFPAIPFNVTVWPSGANPTAANCEIVRVSWKSTDTFTISRTQESTSARTIGVGDQIALCVTAKMLTDIEGLFPITEGNLSFSDVSTGNSTNGAHGLMPKLHSGLSTNQFMRGDGSWGYVEETGLYLTDVTTKDVSTSAHGFTPKAPADTTKFFRGDATWAALPSNDGNIILGVQFFS
jgi:hypothetical protein